MTLPIKTDRLLLRRFQLADAGDLLEFIAHPSVARAVPEMAPTETGVREYIERQNSFEPFERDQCFDLAIELVQEARLIGLLTLITRENNMGEIGWALNFDYRGWGYASEAAAGLIRYAFTELGLHRIQAGTSLDNPESIKVMEHLGMVPEAVLREAEIHDGRWTDGLIYGLLAGDLPAVE